MEQILRMGFIIIDAIKSEDQLADILFKSPPEAEFVQLRYIISGIVLTCNTPAYQGSVINSE